MKIYNHICKFKCKNINPVTHKNTVRTKWFSKLTNKKLMIFRKVTIISTKNPIPVLTEMSVHFPVGRCVRNMCAAVVKNIRDEEKASNL